VLPLVLQELETPRALGLAELAHHNREVALRTHSALPPGAQLHLLTIGISAYNPDYAKSLRLNFAAADAHDLASALINTQASLYPHVDAQVLLDRDANKAGILRALKTLRADMARGGGDDLAVVHFSGHGALVDGKLYLLPYEVDARDAPSASRLMASPPMNSAASSWNLPSTGGCWCCSMPAIPVRPRRTGRQSRWILRRCALASPPPTSPC
jgi:hypothetical protein